VLTAVESSDAKLECGGEGADVEHDEHCSSEDLLGSMSKAPCQEGESGAER
jgi:hypothetical protein